MNDAYSKHYAPMVHLTVHRRIIFQQYVPKKNKCFGTNIYKLCDMSEYIFDTATYLQNDRICASGNMTDYVTVRHFTRKVERHKHKLYTMLICLQAIQ